MNESILKRPNDRIIEKNDPIPDQKTFISRAIDEIHNNNERLFEIVSKTINKVGSIYPSQADELAKNLIPVTLDRNTVIGQLTQMLDQQKELISLMSYTLESLDEFV